jgi:hypothetical protein
VTYDTSCPRAPSVYFADELADLPGAGTMHRTVLAVDNVPAVAPPPDTTPVILPPPEPPPMDMLSALDCLPEADHAAFARRIIKDDVWESEPGRPRDIPAHASRIIFPRGTPVPPPLICQRTVIQYNIPLDKARRPKPTYFPQGSIMDPSLLVRPASPTTPFEFPFDVPHSTPLPGFGDYVPHEATMESVTRVVGLPRVFGLKGDELSYAKVTRAAIPMDAIDNPSLMDGGANICITGVMSLLVDVETIPPLPISVATKSGSISLDDCCTKRGLIPLQLSDGSVYYQPCYYCKNATETIISPEAIVAASDTLVHWTQQGHKGDAPGCIRFTSDSGLYSISLVLEKRDGLYYCPTDVFTVDRDPIRHGLPVIRRVAAPDPPPIPRRSKRYIPVTPDSLTESEVWMLRLGSPGEDQLDLLPGNVLGVPPGFHYHPFRFVDWKEEARIQKQAAMRSAERTSECRRRFYMDFGFMRASTSNYTQPSKTTDRVVASYDGFSAYLLVVDEASRYMWVFLTQSKSPPMEIIDTFLTRFGHERGGSIRTDQGGELARSFALSDKVLRSHNYVMEPTGADSPSQNGAVEIYNNKLAIRARTLLYGSGLPAKYWSAALLHSVYLNNRLVHTITKKTPFEGFYGAKPDIRHLKLFGSRVCVKRSGSRRSKLDRHDFKGIFLGYSATDHNIVYLDLDSGVVKRSHHAKFDEAWYLQPSRPPAAQLLYSLGVAPDETSCSADGIEPVTDMESDFRNPGTVEKVVVPWPPIQAPDPPTKCWDIPDRCMMLPLPLNNLPTPPTEKRQYAARAARTQMKSSYKKIRGTKLDFDLTRDDMATIYMSPDPYFEAFEQPIDLRKVDLDKHATTGLNLYETDGRIYLASMSPGTSAAKIPDWRTRIRGAWLIKIGESVISSIADAQQAIKTLVSEGSPSTVLLFAHPEIRPNLSHNGLPIVSSAPFTQHIHDQMNNRWEFTTVAEYLRSSAPAYQQVDSGGVLNVVNRVMKLTRGKLLKQPDWSEWQDSEYLQLNQYYDQGMFGAPQWVDKDASVFHTVWTYAVKALDRRKKARFACDGSPRSGQARILDETYANCVDQTSSRLFYAIAAAENLLIYGADVSNAFAEAPPPKQGFYIYPDRAFNEWWVNHKKQPPLEDGMVIPILSAMQGHPESPRLWEKHADAILKEIGLTPTTHEPCLYSGNIDGTRVIFKRQVDDFAVATPDERTATILLDMIDDKLTIPMKRQGFLDMYNGIDVMQTRDYIKISSKSFIEKICEKYLNTWMQNFTSTDDRPTPLPTDPTWYKKFNAATGDPCPKAQAKLAKTMQLTYRCGVGELIWAMTTTRPDVAFTSVKLSQATSAPDEHHYHGVKHALKYLYSTRDDGIYFWRTAPRTEFKEGPTPVINSNKQDLMLENRPIHAATNVYAYADSDWATCVKTRRSFGGAVIRLAGGTIAYKTKFQPTVAGSSTEAEFMAAYDTGKMILFVRSVLWDLGIPQEAATTLYEDNDACTAMGNAQKPTTRTRHMDIKYFSICEWVERDLMHLERIDTSINMADHFTKALNRALFHRHADFLLGHVPPTYSPVYRQIVGTYSSDSVAYDRCVPESFTTPMCAVAARVHAPVPEDYTDNPWLWVVTGMVSPIHMPEASRIVGGC